MHRQSFLMRRVFRRHNIITMAAALAVLLAATPLAHAVDYNAQIDSLRQENKQLATGQAELAASALTLQETIASLQAEITAIEAQIQETNVALATTRAAIAKAEADLAQQRTVLAANIRQMYLKDNISTLEMLASSKTMSDFVDKEQYRTSVQSKVTATMQKIDALQSELADQQTKTEQLLADQTTMKTTANEKRAENSRLLSLNEAQRTEYDRSIASNNSKITELQRQQALENARYNVGPVTNIGGGDTYPWANVGFPNSISDPWGMYKRQCVSYTAWKVHESGRYMPYWGGRGNAKQWDDNAIAAGIPVNTTPKVGSVGVSNAGTYGHVVYVEAVHDDGTITVSQYNASWDGRYSKVRRATTGLVFIHF